MTVRRKKKEKPIDLEAVRSVPIRDIAERIGLELRSNNKAMCFSGHDKKTPSLSLTPGKNLWHCFGCDRGGGNIELVQQALNLPDWKAAAQWIESQYLHGSDRHFAPLSLSEVKKTTQKQEKESLHAPDSEVYTWILHKSPIENDGRSYLHGRGFTEETICHFQIGETTRRKNILKELMASFSEERLIRSGVVKRGEWGMRFAWPGDFLLFPFMAGNDILYLQGRTLNTSEKGPKYINLYGVKKPLFNLTAITALPRGEMVVLVEGVMDAMAGHQLGINTIGALGASSFTDEWAAALSRYRITVIPDNDNAGKSFTKKITDSFRRRGISINVISLDGAKDLAELLQKSLRDEKNDE